jgi:hypothetical protein
MSTENEKNGLAQFLGAVLTYVAIGAAVMVGMRAVEWLVPAPNEELMVCNVDDITEPSCESTDVPARPIQRDQGVVL